MMMSDWRVETVGDLLKARAEQRLMHLQCSGKNPNPKAHHVTNNYFSQRKRFIILIDDK